MVPTSQLHCTLASLEISTMLGLSVLVLFTIAIQIVSAQPPPNIPPHCRGPPPDVERPHQCCKIPPMFADEDLEACGIPKLEDQPQGGRFRGPPDCSKQQCILKKYNLLKDEDIDFDAVTVFLDKWTEKNSDFKPAVEIAKQRCLGELPGPPQICKADRMVFCIGSTMFVECPTWEDSDNCNKLKEHLDSCKAAVPKPI